MSESNRLTRDDFENFINSLGADAGYSLGARPLVVHPNALHSYTQRGFLGAGPLCDIPECWFYANSIYPDGTKICIYHRGFPYKDVNDGERR